MENFIRKHDYSILIYKEEDRKKYDAVIKTLNETKKQSSWDRIQGVQILKDCRIPSIYHENDYAIIMERDNGNGNYTIKIME